MKLLEVKIHNFRGIHDSEFNLQNYSLLVGSNNSGKSTIIDAIRAFYELDGFKYKSPEDVLKMVGSDSESWVELTFALTPIEYASLAEPHQVPSKLLTVRKYFETKRKDHDGKSCKGVIFSYGADGKLSAKSFYGAKNVQSGKFGKPIYVPAVSRVDEHAKLSGPSALRDLLTSVLSDVVTESASYKKFAANVAEFSELVQSEKSKSGFSMTGFQSDLNELLHPWDTAFSLDFKTPSANQLIKDMLGWDLVDGFHGENQDPDRFGTGFQRHFIYSLIELKSRYAKTKEKSESDDFSPILNLILFEEPEAYLHPPQQVILARRLRSISSDPDWQVLAATHSPHFVSNSTDDIPSLIKLQRGGNAVHVYQITGSRWEVIVKGNQQINEILQEWPKVANKINEDDYLAEMEALKQFLWLNPDRATMFFAEHVLLVEGPTEVALINKLIADGRITSSEDGMFIVDCLGKYNIHRFMNVLISLGVNHSVLHDGDDDRDEHAGLNKLIRDTADEALTYQVTVVPKNVEHILNISVPGMDPRRKPQHALFKYETGQIMESDLNRFCTLVEGCLPQYESG